MALDLPGEPAAVGVGRVDAVAPLHRNRPRQRQRVDYPGAVLLTAGAGALILGLLEGGRAWAWDSPVSIGIFTGGAAVLVVFVLLERRAANPILPLWLFTRRVVVASSAISGLVGALLLGLTSYVPTFTQGSWARAPCSVG